MKKHRATGNPRGRPPSLPFDIDDQVLKALERRMDANTYTVRPNWKDLAREFHVSRSTISRVMVRLRSSGFIESIYVAVNAKKTLFHTLYRLPKSTAHGD